MYHLLIYLDSAAQAWNRNDARAAKALSLRGQSENDLMRKAHREAASHLYESRTNSENSESVLVPGVELYVDLHGLHPEEAVAYLARILREQRASSKPVYAITGTGHHSKGGKDKVGKAVRMWLSGRGIAFREFSVPGDRGNVGGILGIDARTGDIGSAGETEKIDIEKVDADREGEEEMRPSIGFESEAVGASSSLTEPEETYEENKPSKAIPTGPKGGKS
jgi:hypothetical protein